MNDSRFPNVMQQGTLFLTGPAARKSFRDGVANYTHTIEVWTLRGQEDRWHRGDQVNFRKLAIEAYDKRPADAPNPALVPLDADEEGGPFVYALLRKY